MGSRATKYEIYSDIGRSTSLGGDILRWPIIGPFLRTRYARQTLQIPTLVVGIAMIVHGFVGPSLAPKNLATVLGWVHYRGALVLALLVSGNVFCMACPFMLPRQIARKFFKPARSWPRALRNKWFSLGLFILILFCYERFALWSSPALTAALILCYFIGALVVDCLFKHASFCKFVCPIGQFNFIASTISPLEVRVRDHRTCADCVTHDCIRGRRHPERPDIVTQRGCELSLFLPMKVGNMDCTFCLDCARACPHDNVGILSRVSAIELVDDPPRSGIGRLSKRPDISAYAVVFMFGALLNAFGMVSPVYVLERWLAWRLGIHSQGPILGILFIFFLLIEPLALLGGAAWITRRITHSSKKISEIVARYAYSLAPLGFAMWLAHYSFHFLTGLWTVIPVAQNALYHLGITVLGYPRWGLSGIQQAYVHPLELGFITLGLLGSLLVGYRISEADSPDQKAAAFAPWAFVHVVLFLAALWLMAQPMEMRGTFLAS